MNTSHLEPRQHDPPRGWSAETFDRVTDAIAAALMAGYRRELAECERQPERAPT